MHESPQPTHARRVFMGFVVTLTAIAYLDRVCISASQTDIQAALHLTNVQMGYIFSAFTFAYALFEVPGGWLADRFGPRLMIARVVILWSLMTALTGTAQGFLSLLIVRLLFGMGEAGMFPGLARAFTRWVPGKTHASIFGLSITAALVTGGFTQELVKSMLDAMSWRWTFPIFGLIGAVWSIAWLLWFRDDPKKHPGVNAAELALIGEGPRRVDHRVPWREMWKSRSLFALCGVYFGVIYGWYFFLTWWPKYLRQARGFDPKHAAELATTPYITMAAAVFFGGMISDALSKKWGRRRGRRQCGLLTLPLAALTIVIAVNTNNNVTAALLLALAVGLSSFSVPSAWAVTTDIGGKHAGVVSGTMNMFGNIGGALISIVVGDSVEHWAKTDPWLAWHLPLLTAAAAYILSFVCWMFIDAGKKITEA
jgi:MFS transporter, ACS family, glucarate transporter